MTVPDLSGLTLCDPDGTPQPLAELGGGPLLVVQLVRYFGCLPCQDWLVGLDRAQPTLAALGARPLAVGGSADYQATWLRSHHAVTMPLLLDPDHAFRRAVGIGDLGRGLLRPRGLVNYARAVAHGFRPQRITRDTLRAPGVVILGADLTVRWRYVGQMIGDYPSIAEVLHEVGRVSTAHG